MEKYNFSFILLALISFSINSQEFYNYEVSKENPYGKYNPNAPKELLDFKDLIGECECESISKNKDGSWAEPVKMIWRWKYIMNGMAIQDETLKADKKHSGSIRQFDTISKKWMVHYYSSSSTPKTLPAWEGNKEDGKIVLYRDQKAPNGNEGYFRLTFYDISNEGYKWIGEWTDKTENFTFPTWKIACKKL